MAQIMFETSHQPAFANQNIPIVRSKRHKYDSFCLPGVGTLESFLLFDGNYHCFSKLVSEVFKHESLSELKKRWMLVS